MLHLLDSLVDRAYEALSEYPKYSLEVDAVASEYEYLTDSEKIKFNYGVELIGFYIFEGADRCFYADIERLKKENLGIQAVWYTEDVETVEIDETLLNFTEAEPV